MAVALAALTKLPEFNSNYEASIAIGIDPSWPTPRSSTFIEYLQPWMVKIPSKSKVAASHW